MKINFQFRLIFNLNMENNSIDRIFIMKKWIKINKIYVFRKHNNFNLQINNFKIYI
jgi:hypothetical protein